MSKRGASSELNRDNWQEEEESEEFGVFQKATEEEMKGRLIKKARRRGEVVQKPLEPVFNNFTAFNTQPISTPKFSFGLSNSTPQFSSFPSMDKNEGTKITADAISAIVGRDKKLDSFFPVKSTESDKPIFKFSNTSNQTTIAGESDNCKESLLKEKSIKCSTSNLIISKEDSSSNNLYFANLKALNLGVLKWVQQHVDNNPYISLNPVFDDYKKFFVELKDKYKKDGDKLLPSNSIGDTNKTAGSASPKGAILSPLNTEKPSFNFSTADPLKSGSTFNFGAKSQPFSFSGGKTESTMLAPVAEKTKDEQSDPSDEPPIVTVDAVKEEGSVYDKKVKLFYKKDGNYVEKGVGTLYLKPTGEKTQLIVRALNSLGNILLNIVLNSSIPSQRLGKNNVIIMCIPNPPLEPKYPSTTPVSMLIRVKTSEEADDLLAKIVEHKK